MNPAPTNPPRKDKPRTTFRKFMIRGMATLLPAVLTLWLIAIAYGFMRDKIAAPINWGIQQAVIKFTDWPVAQDEDYANVWDNVLTGSQRDGWEDIADVQRARWQTQQEQKWEKLLLRIQPGLVEMDVLPTPSFDYPYASQLRQDRLTWMKDQPEMVILARREQLSKQWNSVAIGKWQVLDLIGLLVAIVLFYFAGVFMSNIVGRRLKDKGESLVDRVPLIRRVYPAVKQVTDFFFGDNEQQAKFNRVVAVEYPRKGLWSVGLVTGDTMRDIQARMGVECLTVFIPSSPTPFTGYVITVPVTETIDLNLTIEDALKFAVSGGVLIPPSQKIDRDGPQLFETAPAPTLTATQTPPSNGQSDPATQPQPKDPPA
ncbi:DUF502 domain-containing protein [Phycisphaeraceae bacterium D3-23]